MITAEICRFGIAHQSRVPHQIADPAMHVGRGVVDIFSVLDPDQIWNLGRIKQAPVPACDTSACAERDIQRLVSGLRHILEPLIDVVRLPRDSVRTVQPHPNGLRSHEKWRGTDQNASLQLNPANQRPNFERRWWAWRDGLERSPSNTRPVWKVCNVTEA